MTKNIQKLIRADLATLNPYSPIEPFEVLEERFSIPNKRIIKLDGNENPYGCSPKVRMTLAEYPYYHIYPDPEQRALRKALENYTSLSAEHIVVGSGSDEVIDLILRLFLEPGDKVIDCPPTFGVYSFSTEVCGGRVVMVPRDENFNIVIEQVEKFIDEKTKAIFIASPNNPTGNIIPEADLLRLLDTGMVVVVDEAYYEFSGVTVAPLVAQNSNLIVLRTFSKWAGLAGLRVGYGLFPVEIAQYLRKIKQPYNVNVAAQIAALESLKDLAYLHSTIDAVIKEREWLFTRLSKLGWLKPYPSHGNFILCSVLKGDATEIHRKLQKQGIFVRYFRTPQLKNCLRISIGKHEDMDALINALEKISQSIDE